MLACNIRKLFNYMHPSRVVHISHLAKSRESLTDSTIQDNTRSHRNQYPYNEPELTKKWANGRHIAVETVKYIWEPFLFFYFVWSC
ncbi:hypothetical protein EUGRSUZ_J02594 [Eucalyptus grandis]|uniref:Uncharacterized protein n=2 Tax=Eucalyptus grandis TaxID=71139 RepID=A0ACC3J9K2_EUCGR|nr:hypothetical protein EUGRSUZ_J02594 [Eucalyptus grandis]